MKKILILVIIFGFLIGTVGIASAQSDINECCKVTNNIEGVGDTVDGSATPVFVGPKTDSPCDTDGNGIIDNQDTGTIVARSDWAMLCLLNTVFTVTNWIFYILTLLAVLFIIYGGFTYLTSSGDPTKSAKGKGILTYAIIGLAIALLAKFVPSLVKFVLGM